MIKLYNSVSLNGQGKVKERVREAQRHVLRLGGVHVQEQDKNEEEDEERYSYLHLDKQEYYDFDYTRGQYYYNYPENHINFAPPDLQKKFFKQFLQNEAQVQLCLLRISLRPFCIKCLTTIRLNKILSLFSYTSSSKNTTRGSRK